MADSVSTEERGFKEGNDYPDTGYGGVSESEPPHHKIHSSDEPLPKPSAGYGEEEGAYEGYTPADPSAGTGVGGELQKLIGLGKSSCRFNRSVTIFVNLRLSLVSN